jgi:3-methylfumaryl-CoA hydratase
VAAPTPPKARDDGTWRRSITPDPVLLFRYSALTFNSHRIHYDMPYVTGEEGYPGLVVHGPLIATLLLDLLRRELPAAIVKSFAFRAVSPLFAGSAGADAPAHRFEVRGKPNGKDIDLWAANPDGALAMDGTAVIA